MAMKPNTKLIVRYLQENTDKNLTAADVAEALGLGVKSVDGSFTSAIQRKEYGYREEAEIETADGKHKTIKYLRLNAAGLALDPDADEQAAE